MQTFMPIAGLAALLIAVSTAVLFRRLLAPATGPRDLDEFRPFNPAFYRPMERLLREDDIAFLRAQPGFDPIMERRLRRQRRAAFRAYLRHLQSDFSNLHRAARFLVTHGATDQSDLAAALIRQSVRFWTRMAWAIVSVELTRLGFAGKTGELLDVPRWMQEQIGAITAPAAA